MKTKPSLYLFFLVYIFISQSCQKELSFDTGNIVNNPPGIVDSSYISKIYSIYIAGPVADTVAITTYSYDNLKRVVSVIDAAKSLYDFAQTSRHYFYNNNDTLPFRSRTVSISANDPAQTMLRYDTSLIWHFYDNTGRNVKDSVIRSVGEASSPVPYYSTLEVRNYSYGTGKIYGFRTFAGINVPNPSYVPGDQKDTATLDAPGNIIANKSYRFDSFTSQFEFIITSAFTYDNRQSAFSKLSNFKTYGVFPNGETFLSELPQYSNRVTQNEHHSFLPGGGGGVHFDFSYTNIYNTNGFVKEILAYDQPPNPLSYGKVSFVYMHL